MTLDNASGQPFRTTRWSLVVAAGRDDDQRQRALDELCAIYWPPVYAFLRRLGHDEHAARDLTQGLFLQLLERNDYESADPERGRFRSYLRTCARNFATDQHRHDHAQKRGADVPHLPFAIGEADDAKILEPADTTTPDQVFERQYAQQLVDIVLERLGAEMQDRGRQQQFEVLRQYLEASSTTKSYEAAAYELDMREGAVKVAVHRMRERYRELLLQEVRQTLLDPDDAADEIDQLLAALSTA